MQLAHQARRQRLTIALVLTTGLHLAALWALSHWVGGAGAAPAQKITSISAMLIRSAQPAAVAASLAPASEQTGAHMTQSAQSPRIRQALTFSNTRLSAVKTETHRVSGSVAAMPKSDLAKDKVEAGSDAAHTAERPSSPSLQSQNPILEAPQLARAQPDYANNPPPAYPALLREQGVGGVVWLRARVERDGSARDIELLRGSGYRLLDEAALNAVQRWRFIPAQEGNETFATWVEFPIRFRLQS